MLSAWILARRWTNPDPQDGAPTGRGQRPAAELKKAARWVGPPPTASVTIAPATLGRSRSVWSRRADADRRRAVGSTITAIDRLRNGPALGIAGMASWAR